jgi:spore germination cell wall hydrolase CwlJ-like protein
MILETAFMCMALNIYHEAKFQSMLGQIAVGQVVMNRVEDSRFPDNVCDVVTQASSVGTVMAKVTSLSMTAKSGGMRKSMRPLFYLGR